jgi:hypothetical protein
MAEPKSVFIPIDGSAPIPVEGTVNGNKVFPADGSAARTVQGTLVTPANKATYIGQYPWLNVYATAPTGATAGAPGAFTPAGAARPVNLAALQGGGVTASPATAWTSGQHVVLLDGSLANWTGSAWAAGAHA